MASNEYLIENEIIYHDLYEDSILLEEIKPKFIQDFIKPFQLYLPDDLAKEFRLPIPIRSNPETKYNPILRLALPEEAERIAEIVKDIYGGTYPYKEMEDPNEIRRMMKSDSYKFIVFLTEERKILGSTCFRIDKEERKGYIRTIVISKKWLGKVDIKKAYITACLLIWNKNLKDILFWWGETRTADAKSQYINRLCGAIPVAWLPNKDIFYNRIESDLLTIAYNKNVITDYRSKLTPKFIPSIEKCFLYADSKFNLGNYQIISPSINLDSKKLKKLSKKLKISNEIKKFGYNTITLKFQGCNSYFTFLYTKKVKNFEKTNYRVQNLEQLYIFIRKYISLAKDLKVRYMEALVSAYKPEHQKIFSYFGFAPRGYAPAWTFDEKKENLFDYVVFNIFFGKLQKNYKLIEDARSLMTYIYE